MLILVIDYSYVAVWVLKYVLRFCFSILLYKFIIVCMCFHTSGHEFIFLFSVRDYV